MRPGAFIDSGAFVAFLDRSDRLHDEARSLFVLPPPRLVTSILVVSETYSWFLHRLGEEAARKFRALLARLPGFEILETTAALRSATERKLELHRGQELSWVDASSLVWIEELRPRVIWGCDLDLAIEGARVVPGPPPDLD